jgi:glutamyl-tRNA synthetase
MRTRIAPTPSGFLHAGNAFNFLVTDKLAKALGAKVLLRIDDLDVERSRPEYVEDIFRSLEWLGVRVDEGPSGPEDFARNWSQQNRTGRYGEFAEKLRSAGHLYPCACSRSQLEDLSRGGVHACRDQRMDGVAVGTPWRLRIPVACPVVMNVLEGSDRTVDLAAVMSDPVILQRTTGRPAYQVASLCDDLEMGITFIVRGADLLPSTACQLYLAQVLQADAFRAIRYHHHPLALGADGQKLSKSAGAASLKAMREGGLSPGSLIAGAEAYAAGLLRQIIPS